MTNDVSPTHCGFCGKSKEDVRVLVAGLAGNAICNECVMLSAKLIIDGYEVTTPERIKAQDLAIEGLRKELDRMQEAHEHLGVLASKLMDVLQPR